MSASCVSHIQSADDHRAKEELAKQQGYEPPQAHPPEKSPFQVFDVDESESTGYEKMAKPTVEASAQSTIRVLKEAVNTMMHGVNNAGQPEIEQKLKEIKELEGKKRT
ncbi:hypothetical protein DUNSADRAFT_11025 [Dunaliella salina]|uniref:Encoded protein n=1 Tax=Dunaliella salina TaxID=3046 RepID=A0ABQ7GE82_DUNSA|nr:hypothetical protein DUNSADRAFT_11025 [Dunaliella salina]|eukprot:KAF5832913.1 hypothetical protein DUNSADRAFT_11025 [Dunaliella salina]